MSPPAPPPFNVVAVDIAATVPAVVVVAVAVVGVAGVFVVFAVVVVVALAPFDCSWVRLSLVVVAPAVPAGDGVVSLLFLLL